MAPEDRRGELATRFQAFLSYSHVDAAAARKLHRRLETYRLPRRLEGHMPLFPGVAPGRLGRGSVF